VGKLGKKDPMPVHTKGSKQGLGEKRKRVRPQTRGEISKRNASTAGKKVCGDAGGARSKTNAQSKPEMSSDVEASKRNSKRGWEHKGERPSSKMGGEKRSFFTVRR